MKSMRELSQKDVVPALGCTEPIAVALACCVAREALMKKFGVFPVDKIEKIFVKTDGGVFKNGMGVTIPKTFGEKGGLVAACLGTICGNSVDRLQVLSKTEKNHLNLAKKMISSGKAQITYVLDEKDLFIEAVLQYKDYEGFAIIRDWHTNVIDYGVRKRSCIKTEIVLLNSDQEKNFCAKTNSIEKLIFIANNSDEEDLLYVLKGVQMNFKLASRGFKFQKVGYHLLKLRQKGIISRDLVSKAKILISCATDARMSGENLPAMSSGGSGNQGIVSSLLPYIVGINKCKDKRMILKSIVLSHLVNSHIKNYTGNLSAMCGCAIAAGAGAAAAIAFQEKPNDLKIINNSIKNVIADITGIICDGAKESCSSKVVTSVDSSFRAAYLAVNGLNVGSRDGIIEEDLDETLKNIGELCKATSSTLNKEIICIMHNKLL